MFNPERKKEMLNKTVYNIEWHKKYSPFCNDEWQKLNGLKNKAIKQQMYIVAAGLRDAEKELFRLLNDKVSEKILNSIHKPQP